MKECKKCSQIKEPADFHSRRSVCKRCVADDRKRDYQLNKKSIRERANRYWAENKDIINKTRRIWLAANRDAVNKRNRIWKKKNIEKARVYQRKGVRELQDHYVKNKLYKEGWPKEFITKEIIDIKKTILLTNRKLKQ
jgi:hypothetical protein